MNRGVYGLKLSRRGAFFGAFPCQRRCVTYDARSRADPAYTQLCSFPGRVESQQQRRDRFKIGLAIAINPLNLQHFVEIYQSH